MSGKTKGVITTCCLLTVIIGTLNNIIKQSSLPSFRFFAGNGFLYLFLVGLGEWEEEVSKAIALAIATFVVLGEGGGVVDHFLGRGVASTTLDTTPPNDIKYRNNTGGSPRLPTTIVTRPEIGSSTVAPVLPVKPVVPNSTVIHNI